MSKEYADLPIIVLGGGLAGMGTALALIKAGHKVIVCERYPRSLAAGSILNLWPPPVKAMQEMGVDTKDFGSPCITTFSNAQGRVRARIDLPPEAAGRYGGGFLGLLRPDIYTRMLAALPSGVMRFNCLVQNIKDFDDHVTLTFANGEVLHTLLLIGADGIDSMVRAHLWGSPTKRHHNLHVIGGYNFADCPLATPNIISIHHGPIVQGSWCSHTSKGREGFQWWFVEAWPHDRLAPENLKTHAQSRAVEFPPALKQIVDATDEADIVRWAIRDRLPSPQWSKGRITLVSDAAHATSPYIAYGAGMSTCDGYFLAQTLYGVSMADTAAVQQALKKYEDKRVPHTSDQVQAGYFAGQLFHHTPWPLTYLRDFILDYTPFLQKMLGDQNPKLILEQLRLMGDGIRAPFKEA